MIRSNIGADGLSEMSAVLKESAEHAGTPTDSDKKHGVMASRPVEARTDAK